MSATTSFPTGTSNSSFPRSLRSVKGRLNLNSSIPTTSPKSLSSSKNGTRGVMESLPKVIEEPQPRPKAITHLTPSLPVQSPTKERKKKRKDKYDRPLPPTPPPSESILSPESGFELVVNDNASIFSSSPTLTHVASTSTFSSSALAACSERKYCPDMVWQHYFRHAITLIVHDRYTLIFINLPNENSTSLWR
ncbi:hypothetical protein BT96DRAFT_847237, partial [Gymnopus androsaceus JB14]